MERKGKKMERYLYYSVKWKSSINKQYVPWVLYCVQKYH